MHSMYTIDTESRARHWPNVRGRHDTRLGDDAPHLRRLGLMDLVEQGVP